MRVDVDSDWGIVEYPMWRYVEAILGMVSSEKIGASLQISGKSLLAQSYSSNDPCGNKVLEEQRNGA